MKTTILDINGKEKGSIELPKEFSAVIRDDVVARVLEAKKSWQPYSPSLVAGKQHAAKGKTVHRRHVWKSGYGRGRSRVPRKIFSRRGTQFNWEAAEVPFARGGMRAHPPKVLGMINDKKVNKKELKLAFASALSATGNEKEIKDRYESLKNVEIKNVPFVVEDKIVKLKAKDFLGSLKKILGEKIFGVAVKKKTIRAGKGKARGRKYKKNAGLLLVLGKDEKLKNSSVEIVNADVLGINDLARGGLGRLAMFTEKAIKQLGERK